MWFRSVRYRWPTSVEPWSDIGIVGIMLGGVLRPGGDPHIVALLRYCLVPRHCYLVTVPVELMPRAEQTILADMGIVRPVAETTSGMSCAQLV